MGSIPGSVRSPEVGKGNPLQYFCMEKSTDREAWQATVHGVTRNQTRLSEHACTYPHKNNNCARMTKVVQKKKKKFDNAIIKHQKQKRNQKLKT